MAEVGGYGGSSNLALHNAGQTGTAVRHTATPGDGVFSDIREDIDGTPKAVALIGLAALAVMYGLKQMGFRFSFGVAAGR